MFVEDLRAYGRFAVSLPRFLRQRETAEGALLDLRDRLANRETNFLRIVEQQIYGHPRSPYLALLREAGCELGDLQRLVRENGLEAALLELRRSGVTVSFEQFKGREPLVVNGRVVARSTDDFNRPSLRPHLWSLSSGSTGAPGRNPLDLEHRAVRSRMRLAAESALGLRGLPTARIRGRLPVNSSFGGALEAVRSGTRTDRWWVPEVFPRRRTEWRFRLAHAYVMAMARVHGGPFARPEPLRMRELGRVARWASEQVEREGGCLVRCYASIALRIALEARAANLDLRGATFLCGGEPLTVAKREGIESSGARALAGYNMTEAGFVGAPCLEPRGPNEQHLMTPLLGVIQWPRRVGAVEVDALLFTSLCEASARVLLNVEMDDYAVIDERHCGCPLDRLGLRVHVRDVRSFKKLTAHGLTLVGSDLERVLEKELPARFGGSALDYQLAEEEDEAGFTRVCLRVGAGVPAFDPARLVDALVAELERVSISADLAARAWREAGAIRVVRAEPRLGGTGKLQPLGSGLGSRYRADPDESPEVPS